MSDRTSAVYVCNELAGSQDSRDWRRIVLSRIEQVAGRDAHVTMARIHDIVVYLVEGEAAAVADILKLTSKGCDDPDACWLIGSILPCWGARPGRLMTPVLAPEETRWIASRLGDLSRNAVEIRACLRWANMRTRETAFFDFGWGRPSQNDNFPSVAHQHLDYNPEGTPVSLDFRVK